MRRKGGYLFRPVHRNSRTPRFQGDALEQDAVEVLRLVRSLKNAFAPINQLPREVFSLIPRYCDTEGALITLTHVSRSWRGQLISCSWLWKSLDCAGVDQTRVYLERSKTSPLDICLGGKGHAPFINDAFLLTLPHIGRLKGLSIVVSSNDLVKLTYHFLHHRAPLLKKLRMRSTSADPPTIEAAFFDGDLSSLRELRLSGVLTDFPWRGLSNLKTFDLRHVPRNKVSVTQLLDFFERAPALCNITILRAFLNTSNTPRGRMVSLPHLGILNITAEPVHSILLNHLLIPTGAELVLEFDFSGEKSPILVYLPSTSKNLGNLSHITSINLRFNKTVTLRLKGPSGGFCMYARWVGAAAPPSVVHGRVLRSLNRFNISTAGSLTVTRYRTPRPPEIEKSPVYQTLLLTNTLRTLTLAYCVNLPFAFALNPNRIFSKAVVCPKLEELVLYINTRDRFCINELLEMTKERASIGAKLLTLTIVCSREFVPAKEVEKLRDHVPSVEYRLDDVVSEWDCIPIDVDDADYETDSDWY